MRGRFAVGFWVAATLLPLCALSVAILKRRNFPLDIGLIHTTGRAGLLPILLPAGIGMAGLLLLRRRIGAMLIGLYALYWFVMQISVLPMIWNAESSFCLRGLEFCISGAWQGRLLVMTIAALFASVVFWSSRQLVTKRGAGAPGLPAA